MDRIKSAARQSDAVTLPVRQAGFNHYIPAVFYLIVLYRLVMRPLMPEAIVLMTFVTFMPSHFVKMPAFMARNPTVMISPSASHFITILFMMSVSRLVSVHIAVPVRAHFVLMSGLFAISYLRGCRN